MPPRPAPGAAPARPMPDSLSQINRRGTRPNCCSNSQDPSSRSSVFLVGIIRASMNRECAAVITSTGSSRAVPSSNGIRCGGNHRSHCAASPASQTSRSAGSGGRRSGRSRRSRRTLSRNHVIDPSQPTRSAITVAGISGCSTRIARTRPSNAVNDVATAGREYRGGESEATARATVDRPTPRSLATCRCGTPSATSRRINAQSSTEITHPLCPGGLRFDRRYGLVFERRRHLPGWFPCASSP